MGMLQAFNTALVELAQWAELTECSRFYLSTKDIRQLPVIRHCGRTMVLFKNLIMIFGILMVIVSSHVSRVCCASPGHDCTFDTPYQLISTVPRATPILLEIDIRIIGLSDVPHSGGSFEVNAEYVAKVLSLILIDTSAWLEIIVILSTCRITLTWVDKRFVGIKRVFGGNISYNEHRLTECPSNEIAHEDTLLLWKPS